MSASPYSPSIPKPMRKKWQHDYPLFIWYTIAGVAGFYIILNALQTTHRFFRRRAAVARRQQAEKASSEAEDAQGGSVPLAGVTLFRKTFIWREFSVGLWKHTPGEVFFSVGYLLMVLMFGLIHLPLKDHLNDQMLVVANRCGLLVYCQLPFLVGLAGKNNVISWLTGISYEKLNFLHRSASRSCLILAWVHVLGRGMVIPMKGEHAITAWEMQMGVVAFISFNLVAILGIKPFLRNMAYEVFLISHVVLVLLFIVGLICHWVDEAVFLWPALLLWGLDRFARLGRTIFINKLWLSFASTLGEKHTTATVEALHGSALKMTLRRSLSWTPGQHAYLVCPTVSRFPLEAHPFTISSTPSHDSAEESEITFLVRVRDGFTGRLSTLAKASGGKVDIPCWFDGPYGIVQPSSSFSGVVLVAGGTGVTYALPQLQETVRQVKAGTSAVRIVTFVWVVRTIEHISWISKSLEKCLDDCPSNLIIDLKIFVTFTGTTLTEGSGAPTPVESREPSESSHSGDEDEEKHTSSTRKAPLPWIQGRPDLDVVFKDAIRDAKGPVSVRVCGPSSLSGDVRKSLISGKAFTLGDVTSGRAGSVDLHVESFGW